jgi:hypothetical protein
MLPLLLLVERGRVLVVGRNPEVVCDATIKRDTMVGRIVLQSMSVYKSVY